MQAEVVDTQAKGSRAAMLWSIVIKKLIHLPRTLRPAIGRSKRILWFIAVGCSAAAVHWCIVVLLVSQWQWQPLSANVLGWLVALGVSFTGHHRLTFGDLNAAFLPAARRFILVSALGFAINEASYALLLQWGVQRYDLALAVVLVGVAIATYLLSRHWAFLRSEAS